MEGRDHCDLSWYACWWTKQPNFGDGWPSLATAIQIPDGLKTSHSVWKCGLDYPC